MTEACPKCELARARTTGQVATNWLLRKGITFPIFGASRVEQAKENCAAAGGQIENNELVLPKKVPKKNNNSIYVELVDNNIY